MEGVLHTKVLHNILSALHIYRYTHLGMYVTVLLAVISISIMSTLMENW